MDIHETKQRILVEDRNEWTGKLGLCCSNTKVTFIIINLMAIKTVVSKDSKQEQISMKISFKETNHKCNFNFLRFELHAAIDVATWCCCFQWLEFWIFPLPSRGWRYLLLLVVFLYWVNCTGLDIHMCLNKIFTSDKCTLHVLQNKI